MPTTPIQSTEFPTPDQWRNTTFSSLGNYGSLAARPWSQLKHIELFPGVFLHSSPLILPTDWLPPGSLQRLSSRTVDPRRAGCPSDTSIAERRDEAVRRALLALWLPGLISVRFRAPAPATWINYAQRFLELARWQFDNRPSEDGSIFGGITRSTLHNEILPAIARSDGRRVTVQRTISKIVDAGTRGIISDWPRDYDSPPISSENATIEDLVVGAPELTVQEKKPQVSWPPFSDEFVTEFFSRAIWIIENIADDAYRLWLDLRLMPERLGKTIRDVTQLRAEAIANFKWTTKAEKPLHQLPFSLHYYDGATSEWPPRDMQSFNRVIVMIQSTIASFVGLCTGARSSEILGAKDSELQLANNRFHSRIFKFSGVRGGKRFDWPLHPIAVGGVQIQQRLARALRPDGTEHLWIKLKNLEGIGLPTFNLSASLLNAVTLLGLEDLTGDKNPHFHRFRHTLARLIALTLVSAPQILQDLFGHADLEHTCTYLCSDPEIVEAALKVAEELSYAIAEEAIKDTFSGDTSGPAAGSLKRGLETLAIRRGETEFATSDLSETIKILTFNSRTWQLIRPGVLCTKPVGDFGPCTRGRGAPDPGSCRTYCDHRLETARAKDGCREMLGWLVGERINALNSGESMLAARLDGEICAHLERWEDVREEILAANPELCPIWNGRNSRAAGENVQGRKRLKT